MDPLRNLAIHLFFIELKYKLNHPLRQFTNNEGETLRLYIELDQWDLRAQREEILGRFPGLLIEPYLEKYFRLLPNGQSVLEYYVTIIEQNEDYDVGYFLALIEFLHLEDYYIEDTPDELDICMLLQQDMEILTALFIVFNLPKYEPELHPETFKSVQIRNCFIASTEIEAIKAEIANLRDTPRLISAFQRLHNEVSEQFYGKPKIRLSVIFIIALIDDPVQKVETITALKYLYPRMDPTVQPIDPNLKKRTPQLPQQ